MTQGQGGPLVRPQGRAETDSLYFSYPQFEAPRRQRHGVPLASATPVAIVGAGPVGMTAALALAKEGQACILLDNKATFNDGSRAICIGRPSFYILERLGAAKAFLDKSLGWTMGRSFYRGQQILEFHMPDSSDEKYRPMYNLQQQYIEQYLWQAVADNPLIETRWQTEVVAIQDRALETGQGATLSLRDPYSEDLGDYELSADWVLACDGARSSIRRLRGLRLQGENFEGRYVIADVQMEHDYPTIRRALFDPKCRPGGTVLIHRQPDNIWRIDYQLSDGERNEDATREEAVRTSVASVLAEIGYDGAWELEWWSVYSANTLALDDYRDGRVFFVGDSAHIVPIFGVRGLNNGLADAANIGWKLGWLLKGKAGADLLESYTPERRGATLDVFANASKSARFMTPSSQGWQVMRDAALSLALTHDFAGQLANPRQFTAYTYSQSPAVLGDDPAFDGGPEVGAHLPDCHMGDGFLSDTLGPGFSLICFDPDLADRILQRLADAQDGLGLTGDDLRVTLLEPSSPAAKILAAGPSCAYLVRPDRHVGGRWFQAQDAEIIQGLAQVLYLPTPSQEAPA